MATLSKMGSVERLALQGGITCAQDATSADSEAPILPLPLRDDVITEEDVEVLLRVARDKNAAAGRYKRTPKKLPTAERK